MHFSKEQCYYITPFYIKHNTYYFLIVNAHFLLDLNKALAVNNK